MIIIVILLIIGTIIETLLICNTLVTLRLIDNEQEYDKEFWDGDDK